MMFYIPTPLENRVKSLTKQELLHELHEYEWRWKNQRYECTELVQELIIEFRAEWASRYGKEDIPKITLTEELQFKLRWQIADQRGDFLFPSES